MSYFGLLSLFVLAFTSAPPAEAAQDECTVSVDCMEIGCNVSLWVACTCSVGPKRCTACTCSTPGCTQDGACCCTDADGTRCTTVSCGRDFGSSAGAVTGESTADRSPYVTDVQLPVSNGEIQPGQFKLHNPSNRGLIAYEIWWDIETPEGLFRFGDWADQWVSGTPLLSPNGEMTITTDMDVSVRSHSRKINRVTPTVAYAEYEDGTWRGTQASIDRFRAFRAAIASTMLALRTAYNNGGEDAFLQALRVEGREEIGQRAAKVRLREIHRQAGLTAALSEIARVTSRARL